MSFSIRSMLVATLVFAIVIAAYKIAPTLTLSFVLLAPLPAIGVALLSRRKRKRWRLMLCAALPAAFAFYVGLIGPLTALVVMPEDWGLVQSRPRIVLAMNRVYPSVILDSLGDSLTSEIVDYQTGWASFVLTKDDLEATLGTDVN